MKSRGVSNLRDVIGEEKRCVQGEAFVDFMKSLHEEVRHKLEQNNQKYKDNVDRSRRHKIFEVGNEVMVRLKKGRFSIGTYNKLKIKKFGPCKILRRFDNGNVYEVELLDDIDISPIFNLVYLCEYYEC